MQQSWAQLRRGRMQGVTKGELLLDLDCWQLMRFPTAMLCAVCACQNGVKRAHLVRCPAAAPTPSC